ncbi:MAG: cytochrome c oxidase subunit II [Nitriliruptorales bacterium]|nr:cytochrome c oxidase subunit II [Nitriliruptorales bacterium]
MRRRRPISASHLRVLVVLGIVALAATACSDAPQSMLDPQGPFAEQPDDLFQLVMWIALVIFVIVQGLIIYSVIKFRQRDDDDTLPVQVHGNTKLELVWTIIPALILAGIAVPTVRTIFELSGEPQGSITVEVIGHRWWWEYHYPDHGGFRTANELVIPTGVPVHLQMTAEEAGGADKAVIHSFWIPALAGKQDVVPGRHTELNLQADEPGRYLGQCAEYCGLSHANMRARAVAMPPDEFEQWVEDQNAPAQVPSDGLAAEGASLFVDREGGQACAACHAINGLDGAQGNVGPDLTHLMSRREFAGAIFPLYEELSPTEFDTSQPREDLLAQWLKDAPSMKPMQPEFGVGMPNLGLTDQEVEALVAFLLTLK